MDFRLLGPLEVFAGPAQLQIAAGRQRALLAILLLHANRTVSRDQIVDGLWGEDVPNSAQKMVQIHVSQLRKALPEPRLRTRAPGYVLEVRDDELDLARFERSVAHGRRALSQGDAAGASRLLRDALALCRSGRHAEALASYQTFRRTLAEELGIEPSASLRGLERLMLQQDPTLELPASTETRAAAPAPGVETVSEAPGGD